MNKNFFIICLSFLLASSSALGGETTNHYQAKRNANVIVPYESGGSGTNTIEEIDLGDSIIPKGGTIPDFSYYNTVNLGQINKVDDYETYSYVDKVSYESGLLFHDGDTQYTKYEDCLSRTYIFEKNIDLPIYEIESRKVTPNSDPGYFRINHTETITTTQGETTTESVKKTLSETASLKTKFEVNGGVTLEGIFKSGVESSTEAGTSVTTTEEYYYEITKSLSKSLSFGLSVEQYTTISSEEEYSKMYVGCFRQLYKIGFITTYQILYTQSTTYTGFMGIDKIYEYDVCGYQPIGVTMFLIPLCNPYFEFSIYKVGDDGISNYINIAESNVFYL